MESNNDKLSYRPISDGDSSAWYYSGGIDEMTSTGCFILKFNHVNTDAGLPMSVCQENHYINAILIVTESGTGDNLQKNRLVGQTLILPQCGYEKTYIYTRTLKCADTVWQHWTKVQQNTEVGQVTSLDTYIDSGVYIGTYTGASLCETFVMVVIENKSTANIVGNVRSVSQFKYSLNLDGTFSLKTRTGQGNESVTWGSWVDIGAADTTDIQDNSITALKLSTDVRAKIADVTEIKNKALQTDTVHITATIDKISLDGRSINGTNTMTVDIPVATTEKAGVMSAKDRYTVNHIAEKEITIEAQYAWQQFQLDFVIHKGSSITVEGDFRRITCRTNKSDTDYLNVLGSAIADRDITYISAGGTGTVVIKVKGKVLVTIDQNATDIEQNAIDINDCNEELSVLEQDLGYISTLVKYPARKDGSDTESGYYKGYEVALDGLYAKGYRYIKCKASSYTNSTADTAIIPCLIYGEDGDVESAVTGFEKFSVAWYVLPLTENSYRLRASYAPQPFGDYNLVFTPYRCELLTENLSNEIYALVDNVGNISDEVNGLSVIIEGNSDELEVSDIIMISNPARLDLSSAVPTPVDQAAGYFKGYKIDLIDYRDRYDAVYFRGANYGVSSNIIRGYILDTYGIVESYIENTESASNGWQELPLTNKSATLVATYCYSSGGGEVWSPENVIMKPRVGISGRMNNIEGNISDITTDISELSDRVGQIEQRIDVFLPENMYVLKGRLTQLFFRGFIKAVDPYVYDIKVLCDIGKTYKRYYEIEYNTIGDFPLKIEVRDNNRNVIGVANTVVKIVEPSSVSAKNILCCGASGTAPGHWSAELKRMLADGSDKYPGLNLPVSFVGRKAGSVDSSVQLEATGGWTWSTFIRYGAPSVRFNITSLNGNIGVDTKLIFNDPEKGTLTYIVQEVNLTDGIGNIRCAGDLPSVISGTLTGDSISMIFDNVAEESFIPFYNSTTGNIDFKSYADRYCNGKIDVIVTHLGVNSVLRENSVVPTASIKDFLNGYFKDFPEGKVVISAIPLPDYGTNVYANAYKDDSINRYGTLCAFFDYNKALYEISMLDEYKGKVVYCPSNIFFDTDYGYPKKTKNVNSRISAITEQIDTNGVHPIKEGSFLIADSILPTFVSFVA